MKSPAAPVRLDHVYVAVRDRRLAAAWYRRVLQLRVTDDYARHGDAHAPLVLSGDNNATHVALFVDATAVKRKRTHIGTVALRVLGPSFLRCLGRLRRLGLHGPGGRPVTAGDVVDHGNSFSVYVVDPDGNPAEITTSDRRAVERASKR